MSDIVPLGLIPGGVRIVSVHSSECRLSFEMSDIVPLSLIPGGVRIVSVQSSECRLSFEMPVHSSKTTGASHNGFSELNLLGFYTPPTVSMSDFEC